MYNVSVKVDHFSCYLCVANGTTTLLAYYKLVWYVAIGFKSLWYLFFLSGIKYLMYFWNLFRLVMISGIIPP